MPGMNVQMRSVRSIFRDDYAIGAFQRGYSWEHENVAIMLRDFARAFERRRRSEVSGDYYLGAVVTHAREGYRHIIDGQQRLTTLLLLLIWAAHELRDIDRRLTGLLLSLIVHQGPRGACFAIDVDERISVFRALFDDPSLNQGLDLNGRTTDETTEFRICVAANPTAVDLDVEIEKLGGNLFEVTVTLRNTRAMHSRSHRARQEKLTRPDLPRTSPMKEVLAQIDHLDLGNGADIARLHRRQVLVENQPKWFAKFNEIFQG